MRYPVVNLRPQLGGLLEDYEKEIAAFKAKLYKPSSFRGFEPPPTTYPPAGPAPVAPIPPPEYGIKYFPSLMPPMVATGPAPTPRPGEISVYQPPTPPPQLPPMDPFRPRPSVATGIPQGPYPDYPPATPPEPPLPPSQECPSGYTWTPSGCLKDVASVPNRPPIVNQPVSSTAPAGNVNSGGINSGGYSWNSAPGVNSGTGMPSSVPSVDCGPGKFWDGAQCRGSVSSMPGIPGGTDSSSTTPSSATTPIDVPSGLVSNINANLGQVTLRGILSGYVRPRMLRIVR